MRSNGWLVGFCLLLGAFCTFAAGPVGGKADDPHQGKSSQATSHQAADHKKPHEPTAADEVADQDETWELFNVLEIHLPLVGWFKVFGYQVPTKYMYLALIAASLIIYIYIKLAQKV